MTKWIQNISVKNVEKKILSFLTIPTNDDPPGNATRVTRRSKWPPSPSCHLIRTPTNKPIRDRLQPWPGPDLRSVFTVGRHVLNYITPGDDATARDAPVQYHNFILIEVINILPSGSRPVHRSRVVPGCSFFSLFMFFFCLAPVFWHFPKKCTS